MNIPVAAPTDPNLAAVAAAAAAAIISSGGPVPGGTPLTPGRIGPSRCQVTGCNEDLTDQSQYNRRYKICDTHRKMLSVDMNGTMMRFCQQCARLQGVDKFKGDRRSCQARLEIHNKRRAQGKGATAAVALGHLTILKCQVPECVENLLEHKAYNQRYKICPHHRTRTDLEINGQHVRFCQQCAKLHSVSDFDGSKRSCKDKLEKHNNRRLQLKKNLEQREAIPGQEQPPGSYCQVPGCQQDLRDMKVYNIRYKVCSSHLIMPEINLNDQLVRFCQQCARFQPVSDFDGLKRSCRSRLEKHNQRRRVAAQEKEKGEKKDDAVAVKQEVQMVAAPAPATSMPAVPWTMDATQIAPGGAYDPQQLMNALQSMQQLLGAAAANQAAVAGGGMMMAPQASAADANQLAMWAQAAANPGAAAAGADSNAWMGAALSAMSAAMMYGAQNPGALGHAPSNP